MLAEKFIIYLEALRTSEQYQDGSVRMPSASPRLPLASQEVKEKRLPRLAAFFNALTIPHRQRTRLSTTPAAVAADETRLDIR